MSLSKFFDGMHGVIFPFAGSVAPAGFLLCYGQAVSRTTYAALFAAIGTAFGVGDGTTTFNLPDLRGRAIAGLDNMGGSAASRLTNAASGFGADPTQMGASGGAQSHTLGATEMPAHSHQLTTQVLATGPAGYSVIGSGGTNVVQASPVTDSVGSGGAHKNVQPTMVMNWIIKT